MSDAVLEIAARLTAVHDLCVIGLGREASARAVVKAITELVPSLVADMHLLDDTTDTDAPIPQWMRAQLDTLRRGL